MLEWPVIFDTVGSLLIAIIGKSRGKKGTSYGSVVVGGWKLTALGCAKVPSIYWELPGPNTSPCLLLAGTAQFLLGMSKGLEKAGSQHWGFLV